MLITFLLGVVLLLIWLWPTGADATAISLIGKSIPYFVLLPFALSFLLGIVGGVLDIPERSFWLLVVAPIALEEPIKFWAARSQPTGIRTFAFVALFGIWELMLFKPVHFSSVHALPWTAAIIHSLALPAAAMHLFTAAIYAFHFRGRAWLQLLVCMTAHAAFNASALLIPLAYLWLYALAFCVITVVLIPGKNSPRRGRWRDAVPEPDAV